MPVTLLVELTVAEELLLMVGEVVAVFEADSLWERVLVGVAERVALEVGLDVPVVLAMRDAGTVIDEVGVPLRVPESVEVGGREGVGEVDGVGEGVAGATTHAATEAMVMDEQTPRETES